MSFRCIDVLNQILIQPDINHVLEWGCGGSTVYFSHKMATKQQWTWISIDMDQQWIDRISPLVDHDHVTLIRATYETWLHPPKAQYGYDLIIVDAERREECIILCRSYGWLSPHGVIALHDAQRSQYHAVCRDLIICRYHREDVDDIWIMWP